MTCQTVTLPDGSTLLVNVKRGQTLTDKDIEMLGEFNRLLQIHEEDQRGVELRPITNGRTRRGQDTQPSLPRRKSQE